MFLYYPPFFSLIITTFLSGSEGPFKKLEANIFVAQPRC